MRKITIGKRYKHFKGNIYEVKAIAKDSESLENMVVYQHVGKEEYWVRPYSMFNSLVDRDKYPDVSQEYRFEEID